ncbi:MAG: hypothetical protein H6733_14935 [Alphaproteobacteria bacterium]|nr:hypothetical protein [Alphaproteobacteria bacterium]
MDEEEEDLPGRPKRRLIPIEYMALGGMLAVVAVGGVAFSGAYEHFLTVATEKASRCDRVTGEGCSPAQMKNIYQQPTVDQARVAAIRGIEHPEAEEAIRANVRAFVLNKPTEPPSREAKQRARAKMARERAAEIEQARRANAPLPAKYADGVAEDDAPADPDHDWAEVGPAEEPDGDWTQAPEFEETEGAADDGVAVAEDVSDAQALAQAKEAAKVKRIGEDAPVLQASPEELAREAGCATPRGSWWIGFWWM